MCFVVCCVGVLLCWFGLCCFDWHCLMFGVGVVCLCCCFVFECLIWLGGFDFCV